MANKKKTPKKETVKSSKSSGTLYVVATPIGNLEDITLRALRILKEVDLIAAEDTRHTRKLLTHFGISTPTMSYYKEKEQERTVVIINKLKEGHDIALVSDAGTPGISDPGSVLVQKTITENINIEPIPGPSALTTALSVAGIHDNSFVFFGFAPSRKKQRQDLLHSLSQERKYMVFFEAPHRIQSFLQDCLAILGDRNVFWCRELTKMHEELTRDSLSVILQTLTDKKVKGESVLIITGAENEPAISDKELKDLLHSYKKSGELSLKDAVQVITKTHNLPRNMVYRRALKIWK